MKISLIITCDTRKGVSADSTRIGEFAGEPLCGCRSLDFLTHGVISKIRFFEGHEIEAIVCVDEHEPLSEEIHTDIRHIEQTTPTRYIVKPADRKRQRFNDWIYVDALKLAEGDYVAKWDGDVAAFRRPEFPIIDQYLAWLDDGYKYICQPTQIHGHGMAHASSRYFICKRETLDFPEIGRCLNDYSYFQQRYPNIHAPCLEFYLGAMVGGAVLYPFQQNQDYTIFSFVEYQRGLFERLNALPYDDVYRYVFETCGGVCGPSDFIPRGMP